MQALPATYGSTAERIQRYKLLLAQLQAATSNAEADDAPVMLQMDAMKKWIHGELLATARRGSTYEVQH
jgi:hypothetical protein